MTDCFYPEFNLVMLIKQYGDEISTRFYSPKYGEINSYELNTYRNEITIHFDFSEEDWTGEAEETFFANGSENEFSDVPDLWPSREAYEALSDNPIEAWARAIPFPYRRRSSFGHYYWTADGARHVEDGAPEDRERYLSGNYYTNAADAEKARRAALEPIANLILMAHQSDVDDVVNAAIYDGEETAENEADALYWSLHNDDTFNAYSETDLRAAIKILVAEGKEEAVA